MMDEDRGCHEEREPAEGTFEESSGVEWIDLRMKRLQINSSMCKHGLSLQFHAASECEEFVATFNAEFSSAKGSFEDCIQMAIYATRKAHADVWRDSTKLDWIVSALLANATQSLLSDNIADVAVAGVHTSFASFFQQWLDLKCHNTLYCIDWVRIRDLFYADERTLRSYLRGRCSSCSCLGEVEQGNVSVPSGTTKNVGWIDGHQYDD